MLPRGNAAQVSEPGPRAKAGPFQGGNPNNLGTIEVANVVDISAVTLPLPTGAATDTTVAAVTTALGTPAQAPTAVTYTHSTVATSTTTALALASNSSARYRLFQNADATINITIALNVAAVADTQILLKPGLTFTMSLAQGNMDTRTVNCIAASGTPNLLVTEGV